MKVNLRKFKTGRKILTCLVLAGSILIGSSGTCLIPANAATNNTNATAFKNTDVTVINDASKLKEFAKKNNIELEKDGKKLSEIVIENLKTSNKTTKVNISNATKDRYGVTLTDYYISNVNCDQTCDVGSKTISKVSGQGPGTLKLDVNTSIPIRWKANNVSASTVSDAVGFDVTVPSYVSGSRSIELSSGESATIYANSYIMNYTFDIMYSAIIGSDIKTGSGYVEKTTGVCFSVYR